jgi:pyridinium-3,5-bisthiocarboxylic acid mononucleotide nickel chelatase
MKYDPDRASSDHGEHQHGEHQHGEHQHGEHQHGEHQHGEHQHGASRDQHRTRVLDGDPEAHRTSLGPRSGEGKLVFFDAPTGLAGDMIIAALIDLGVPMAVVDDAVGALELRGVLAVARPARAGSIGATSFSVQVTTAQEHRHYADIDARIAAAKLSPGVMDLSRAIFRRLAEAEAQVHRVPVESVHFHEVGAADAIVDIVGAAACFCHLGATVVCSPLPMGSGTVECEHGTLPLPAPATLLCLRGVPTYDFGKPGEFVTPTGAAIIATVAERFESWPSASPLRTGFGAGNRSIPGRVNALRVVLADPVLAPRPEVTGDHVVVEANIDDMSGELAAHAIRVLIAAGALDAWVTPCTMKKGRPGMVLSALGPAPLLGVLTDAVLTETHSIGVRHFAVSRTERPRRTVEVTTPFGTVSVKISGGGFGPERIKPEFDECVKLARKVGVPVREVLDAALTAARARQP